MERYAGRAIAGDKERYGQAVVVNSGRIGLLRIVDGYSIVAGEYGRCSEA